MDNEKNIVPGFLERTCFRSALVYSSMMLFWAAYVKKKEIGAIGGCRVVL